MKKTKIDFYFMGDYLYSSTWHKTCKEARKSLLERLEQRKDLLSLVERQILKYPKQLKLSIDKEYHGK